MEGAFAYIPDAIRAGIANMPHVSVNGKVVQVVGTIIKASVPGVKIGEICLLKNPWENIEIHAEVVGFTKESVLLTALGSMTGISQLTEVVPTRRVHMVGVHAGDALQHPAGQPHAHRRHVEVRLAQRPF